MNVMDVSYCPGRASGLVDLSAEGGEAILTTRHQAEGVTLARKAPRQSSTHSAGGPNDEGSRDRVQGRGTRQRRCFRRHFRAPLNGVTCPGRSRQSPRSRALRPHHPVYGKTSLASTTDWSGQNYSRDHGARREKRNCQIHSADTVRSPRASPVLVVLAGSNNNTCTSPSATGMCSTPRGMITSCPDSN